MNAETYQPKRFVCNVMLLHLWKKDFSLSHKYWNLSARKKIFERDMWHEEGSYRFLPASSLSSCLLISRCISKNRSFQCRLFNKINSRIFLLLLKHQGHKNDDVTKVWGHKDTSSKMLVEMKNSSLYRL